MNQLPRIEYKSPFAISSSKPRKFRGDKDKFEKLGNYDVEIEYYTKGINEDKSNALLLLKRAICYLAKGYYTLALKDALKTIELYPYYTKGYYIAALSYLEMYDIDKAEQFASPKNQKLLFMIERTKNFLKNKCLQFKSYSKYLYFLKELYKYDAYFPKLEINFYTDDSRGVFAKSYIQKNEIIMAIPRKCLISLDSALSTEIGSEIGKFMYNDLKSPKHSLLSSFLLTEENNQKWKFYFDFLPKDFSNFPIFFTEKDLQFLKGSPVINQIYEKKVEMKMDYEKICANIPSFTKYSFLKFCKARSLISSRVFGISINNVKMDVLAPFADLLNHSNPTQTKWYYDNTQNSFIVQAVQDIPEGSEIYDSYGAKTNTSFLLNYGFAMENNLNCEYTIALCFNQNCPQYEKKKIFFHNEYEYTKTFKLNSNIYDSELVDLLSFLRFLLFDDDISILYSAMNSNNNFPYEESNTNFYYVSPISKELEIKVLKHLLILCKECLRKYPTTLEEDKKIIKNSKGLTFNMRNCLCVVISEKTVLNYYIYFCEYCLGLFNLKDIEIMKKLQKDFTFIECQFVFYIHGVILPLNKM